MRGLYDPTGCRRMQRHNQERQDLFRAIRSGIIYTVAMLAIAAFVVAIWSR